MPPEVQKYLDITNKARKYLEDFYNSPGWQQQSSASGFVVSTKTDEATGLTLSRGEGIIPYTYEQIYAIIEKVDRRGDYDPLFDSVRIILKIGLPFQAVLRMGFRDNLSEVQNNQDSGSVTGLCICNQDIQGEGLMANGGLVD